MKKHSSDPRPPRFSEDNMEAGVCEREGWEGGGGGEKREREREREREISGASMEAHEGGERGGRESGEKER